MRTEAKTTALQCTEGFKTHSRATGFRGFLKLSVTVLGPNDCLLYTSDAADE